MRELTRYWLISILSLTALFWVGSAVFSGSQDCLTTPVVGELILRDGARDEHYPSCSWRQQLLSESRYKDPSSIYWTLKSRIEGLSRPLYFLPFPRTPIQVEVRSDEPMAYQVFSDRVVIGSEVASARNQLERALFQAWMRQSWSALAGDQFLLEILSDFLVAYTTGHMDGEEPTSRQAYDWSEGVLWPQVLMSFRSYCHSVIRSPSHITYCQHLKDEHLEERSDAQTIWSLRPLIASALWQVFQGLPLSRQGALLSGMHFSWGHRQELSQIPLPPEPHSPPGQYASWVRDGLTSLLDQLLGQEGGASDSELLLVQSILKSRGIGERARIDYFVHVLDKAIEPQMLSSLAYWSEKFSGLSVMVAASDDKPIRLPSYQNWDRKLETLDVQHMLVVHCRPVRLNQKIDVPTSRVTFLQVCPPDRSLRWDRLMASGVEGLLRVHSDLPFTTFHWPSMELALQQMKSQWGDTRDLYFVNEIPRWKVFLEWQKVSWDDRRQAYVPSAVIEAVTAYRPSGRGSSSKSAGGS